jgi:hypothetical protein
VADSIDWKADGGIVAAGIAVLGIARRVLAPYWAKQLTEMLAPEFEEIRSQLVAIRGEQDAAREAREEIAERVATIEGIVDRRKAAR